MNDKQIKGNNHSYSTDISAFFISSLIIITIYILIYYLF